MSKTAQEWRKEIDKTLSEKTQAVIRKLNEEREQAFSELETLDKQAEELQAKTQALIREKSGLNPLVNSQLARRNEIDLSFPRLAKQTKAAQARINELVTRLTAIPPDIAERFFLISVTKR